MAKSDNWAGVDYLFLPSSFGHFKESVFLVKDLRFDFCFLLNKA
jgi:hypothetical protein